MKLIMSKGELQILGLSDKFFKKKLSVWCNVFILINKYELLTYEKNIKLFMILFFQRIYLSVSKDKNYLLSEKFKKWLSYINFKFL